MSHARAIARVDLAAIRHNVARLRAAAGAAELMAVVKADAYGHGALPVARATIAAGAAWLGVVTLDEAAELRGGDITAPILVMGPLHAAELVRAGSLAVDLVAWTPEFLGWAARLGVRSGRPIPIHLKLDTGMGRLGVRGESFAELLAAADVAGLTVRGVMTHFATADELAGPNAGFMREQLARFRAGAAEARRRFPQVLRHAANSAATLREPAAALDLVRCGIAVYGGSPFGDDPAGHDLRPALRLESWVASVKGLNSRESAGYGRHYRAPRGTRIAIVPIGYGDGYARALTGAPVLIGGARFPVVGAVSMDQITVDLGPEAEVAVGEEVVLIGSQGAERITLEELATVQGTINYEISCNLGRRVRREYP